MKTELLKVLERLVEDCEGYTTGTGCVGCIGEPERDYETNKDEVIHEPDCTIIRAKRLIHRARQETDLLLKALEAIIKLKWGTNVMGEKLCPVCSYPGRHKRGCPYPLVKKALAATAVKT